MAEFAISYGGEWETPPVFVVTAKCGHTYRVLREPPDETIEQAREYFGEVDQCPPCIQEGMQAILDEIDYQLGPDTAALGWNRIADAITFGGGIIGLPAEQDDEDLDEETRTTARSVEAAIRRVRSVISEWEEAGYGMDSWREEQTRYAVIDPIISALGWNLSDPKECLREYRRIHNDDASGRVDYALFIKQSLADIGNGLVAPDVIILSTSLNVELDSPHIRQLREYTNAEPPMEKGVTALTNGREWKMFTPQKRGLHPANILKLDPKGQALFLSKYLARCKFG